MAFTDRLHNRGSISTGYDIDNSCKFETANNEWLIRNSPTAGNRKTHTFSFWIKRTALGSINASGSQGIIGQGQHGRMYFGSDYFQYRFDDGHDVRDVTTIFRDTAAWYHIVVAVDTNQASSSNRVKIYFNGVQTTTIDFDGGSYPDIQDSSSWFNTNNITIGTLPFAASYTAGDGDYDMSGYLADFAVVDGTQYAPTDFGEFDDDSGIWKPKDLSNITWGSEGYYLKFDDSSDLGADSSGNSNDFTLSNIAAADQATDTPTNNFATGNAITPFSTSTTVSEGGTKIAKGANGWELLSSTIAVTKGKWYVEVRNETVPESAFAFIFPTDSTQLFRGGQTTNYPASASGDGAVAYYAYNDEKYIEGTWSTYGSGDWRGSTNTIGIALDMDNGYVYFAKGNTYQASGNPTSGSSGTNGIAIPDYTTKPYMIGYSIYAANNSGFINFGGFTGAGISSAASDADGYGTFEYAPPSGYYALCTKNLEEYG